MEEEINIILGEIEKKLIKKYKPSDTEIDDTCQSIYLYYHSINDIKTLLYTLQIKNFIEKNLPKEYECKSINTMIFGDLMIVFNIIIGLK